MNKIVLSLAMLMFSICFVYGQSEDLGRIINNAKVARNSGDIEAAIKWLKQAHKMDKSSDEVMFLLADSYFDNRDYDNALIYSNKVIAKGQEYRQDCYEIAGNCWDKKLRFERAEKVYKEGLSEFPDDLHLQYNLANSYYKAKKYDAAEIEVAKVINIDPGYGEAHLLLAYVNYDRGERIRAMLPLYYYLLIKQDDERAEGVYDFLNMLWSQGIRTKAQRSQKAYNSGLEISFFDQLECQLAEFEKNYVVNDSSYDKKENLNILKLAHNTEALFQICSANLESDYDLWWQRYMGLYNRVYSKNYVECLCNFIASCKYEQDVLYWLSLNHAKFNGFVNWMEIEMHLVE